MVEETVNQALLTDDIVVFCLLAAIIAIIFYTSSLDSPFFKRFYAIVPSLLLCYFMPGLLNTLGVISGKDSKLYEVSSNLLLPACLILMCLNLDLKELWRLRKKAGIMFMAGTIGVFLGGPLAVLIMSAVAPDVVGGEGGQAVWRGLATLAGSWIGGGANQAALYRIFEPSPEVFSSAIAVDIFLGYGWMALLLYGAGKSDKIDKWLKADSSIVEKLTSNLVDAEKDVEKVTHTKDILIICGLAFGATGLAHIFSANIASYIGTVAPSLAKFSLTSGFFWLIVIATAFGIALSFTPAKRLENVGASKIGTAFLYILISTIGMQMDIRSILSNPGLFVVGFIWISCHALVLIVFAKIIRAPFFFLAIGSMANIGGVASASVVAAAFHRSLVPIGVILAVFGYAVGTYAGYVCGLLLEMAAP